MTRTQEERRAALGKLMGLAQDPPARPEPAVTPPETPVARAGRPPARIRTTQISLRIPDRWLDLLHERAGEASRAERRTVTPQALILDMIEATLPEEERRG